MYWSFVRLDYVDLNQGKHDVKTVEKCKITEQITDIKEDFTL